MSISGPSVMLPITIFARQVRARSDEHRKALAALSGLSGQMVSILRQELDSLVRVVFLLSVSDRSYRERLISDSVNGVRWRRKDSNHPITDREMVELCDELHGWTKSVYSFGCAFIHLSNLHDHTHRDPLNEISIRDREAILHHLEHYHGGPNDEGVRFNDVVPYFPMVFDKIAANLEYYVKSLENDEDIDP